MSVTQTVRVTINPSPKHYELIFGENLYEQALAFAKSNFLKTILITTSGLQGLLPQTREDKILLPPGESVKTRGIKEKIEDALIERGCGRECCLIVIGGGALLDLVGFVASTYCRGIPYISMPSTLIAMTDAAIGGKTGINVNEAKNWIGAFHHPRKVFIDFTFLRTLPQKDFLYGLSETIKHSLIADHDFFSFLENHLEEILNRDPSLIREMIHRSCSIKKAIIEKDPYETKGMRRILNFGHTIGHALETLSDYTRPHGLAILMGMKIEAAIARRLDYLSASAYERICHFLHRLPVRMDFPDFLPYELLTRDKKGAYRFVILTGIGSVAPFDGDYALTLTKEMLKLGWEDALCPH